MAAEIKTTGIFLYLIDEIRRENKNICFGLVSLGNIYEYPREAHKAHFYRARAHITNFRKNPHTWANNFRYSPTDSVLIFLPYVTQLVILQKYYV